MGISNIYGIIFFVFLISFFSILIFGKKEKKHLLFENLLPKINFSKYIFFLGFFLLSLGIGLLISGIFYTKNDIEKSSDIVFALDTSLSMDTQDVLPSRLQVAKKTLIDLSNSFSGNRVGLVYFAGKAYISLPASRDYDTLKSFIENLDTQKIDQNIPSLQGTAIGDALLASSEIFDKKNYSKTIILITDGDSNKGILPQKALDYLNSQNIKFFLIGIGSSDGGYLKIGDRVQKIDGVNLETLKSISPNSFLASDQEGLKNIISQILAQNPTQSYEIEKEFEYFWPLIFMLVGSSILIFFHLGFGDWIED